LSVNRKTDFIIEIATTDYTTTKSAVEGRADRIELCAALTEGGTTPAYGTIKKCREDFQVQLFPIIRPRSGDFLYSDEEFDMMKSDINVCKVFGCNGVVIGILNADGSIDKKRCKELVELAKPMKVTFHRAFDRAINLAQALEDVIDIGCERILTSGGVPNAMEGADMIAKLVKQADGRIIIMPGSGVRADNIKMIAEKTGAKEFHSSARTSIESSMNYQNEKMNETLFQVALDKEEARNIFRQLSSL